MNQNDKTKQHAMLDPWIIEEIRRREEEQQRREQGNQLEIPVPADEHEIGGRTPAKGPEKSDRGVTIIDIKDNSGGYGEIMQMGKK